MVLQLFIVLSGWVDFCRNYPKFHNCKNNAAKNFKIVFQIWGVNNFDRGCQNCSNVYNFDGVYYKNFPTFFKAFHSVIFLLTNSQLVHSLVLFTVLSWWVDFLVLFTVLSGWVDFLVKITPREQFCQVEKYLITRD